MMNPIRQPRRAPDAAAFHGRLESMGLADLLQILGQGQHTGTLRVSNGRVEKRFAFARGDLVWAASTDRRESLRRYLLRAGLVDAAVLDHAQTLAAARGLALGHVLVAQGAISNEALTQTLRLKIEEAAAELLRWSGGDFAFARGVLPKTTGVAVAVRVTGVVLEGMHQLDNWRRGMDTLSYRAEPIEPPDGVVVRVRRPVGPRRMPSFSPSARLVAGGVLSLLLATAILARPGFRPTADSTGSADGTTLLANARAAATPNSVVDGMAEEGGDPSVAAEVTAVPSPELAPVPLPETPPAPAQAQARPLVTSRRTTRPAAASKSPDLPAASRAIATPATVAAPLPAPEPTSAASAPSTDVPTVPPPDPLAVATELQPPTLLRSVPPRYPPAALALRAYGEVELRARIDVTGRVVAVELSGPDPGHGFVPAAIAAVRQSRWQPGRRGAAAAEMWAPVRIAFRP